VWRGSLGEAAVRAEAGEPRGEHVVVLGPAPPSLPPDDDEVVARLVAARADGLGTRDAAARVAAELDIPKRRAYELATRREPVEGVAPDGQ
jgi:16S rRNA (cytidine1402-2'-O)-methyltransferase